MGSGCPVDVLSQYLGRGLHVMYRRDACMGKCDCIFVGGTEEGWTSMCLIDSPFLAHSIMQPLRMDG